MRFTGEPRNINIVAMHHVIAVAAEQIVRSATAKQRVVARIAVNPIGAMTVNRRPCDVSIISRYPVIALTPIQLIVSALPEYLIVASAAIYNIVSMPFSSGPPTERRTSVRIFSRIVPPILIEISLWQGRIAVASNIIVAVVSKEKITSIQSIDAIIACTTKYRIGARSCTDNIATRTSIDKITRCRLGPKVSTRTLIALELDTGNVAGRHEP